jgi:threonine dehydrogenase-like Zn-dependent dehydrogenase
MKAMAVVPGKPNSIHLADLPEPSVADIPDGRGVLVEVLRVGVDGTDKGQRFPSWPCSSSR